MNSICNRFNSLFFPDTEFNTETTKAGLACKILRAGVCFGAVAASITASVSRLYNRSGNMEAILCFAGCLVISAVVATVKMIQFHLWEKKHDKIAQEEYNKLAQEEINAALELTSSGKKSRSSKTASQLGEKWHNALEVWEKSKNIEPVLECSYNPSASILKNSNKAILEVLNDALTHYSEQKNYQKVIQIYSKFTEIGCQFFEKARKLEGSAAEESDRPYYQAAAEWLAAPARVFETWQNDTTTARDEEFEKGLNNALQATVLYWYLIVEGKIVITDDDINLVVDSLSEASKKGHPLAIYAEACWKLNKRRLPSDDSQIEPELLKEATEALTALSNTSVEAVDGFNMKEMAKEYIKNHSEFFKTA